MYKTHFSSFRSPHQRIFMAGAETMREAVSLQGKFPLTSAAVEVARAGFSGGTLSKIVTAGAMAKLAPYLLALPATDLAILMGTEGLKMAKNFPITRVMSGTRGAIGATLGIAGEGVKRIANFGFVTPVRMTVLPAAAFIGETAVTVGNFTLRSVMGLPADIGTALMSPLNFVAGSVRGAMGGVLRGMGVFSDSLRQRGDALLHSARDNFHNMIDYNILRNLGNAGKNLAGSAWGSAVSAGSALAEGYAGVIGANDLRSRIQNTARGIATGGGGIWSRITGPSDQVGNGTLTQALWNSGTGEFLRPRGISEIISSAFPPRPVAQQPQPPAQQQPDPYAQAA
jgi:hypothetical protein